MKIMVFDVAAESSGALSVLNDFYQEARDINRQEITWYFIVSKPTHLIDTKQIKVLRFPWVKKSWFHRLFFDYVVASRLVKRLRADKVLSLQNVVVPFTKVYQIVYIHNSLPFVDYRYRFRENKLLWVYQNLIGRNIISSIKKADKVIAQTFWMKKAFVKKARVNQEKIEVCSPKVVVPHLADYHESEESKKIFFYPATGMDFKNHRLIMEACKLLKNRGVEDYNVILTLEKDESDYIAELFQEAKDYNLPIQFVGRLKREEVLLQYAKSVLLFPSFIESYPFPLLEAKTLKCFIIASDTSFSQEILAEYKNAYFFDAFSASTLASILRKFIKGEISYIDDSGENSDLNTSRSLIDLLVS